MTQESKSISTRKNKGPLIQVLDLLSNVKFGIVILVILFIYMTVGSAGILYPTHPNIFHPDAWVHAQMRQWRGLEMTEFEWFHWWPFDVLITMLCVVMTVTTIRKIPLRVVNLGVWMIHVGIIMLCVGSVIYFTTKIEGDAPVVRRAITAAILETNADGEQEILEDARFIAMPGNQITLRSGEKTYDIEVASIDPSWELLSGENSGDRAYSVNLMISGPDGNFIRQVIAGYPEYTEDLVMSDDPQQPFQRSIKVNGTKLVDESLAVGLEFESARWFYLRNDLAKSWALYLRPEGGDRWVERPIDASFLYNDYIADRSWVWNSDSSSGSIPIDPIDLRVSAVYEDDPAPDTTFDVSGFLRYSVMRSQAMAGSPRDPLNPVAWIDVSAPSLDRSSEYQLIAFDSERSEGDGGLLMMRWVDQESDFQRLTSVANLRLEIPELGVTINDPLSSASSEGEEFTQIGETLYGYRVLAVQNDLNLGTGAVSVVIMEIKTPTGLHRRWVFDDPSLTRDVIEGAPMLESGHQPIIADESITVTYTAGMGQSLVTLVAGPQPERLRLLTSIGVAEPQVRELTVGQPVRLPGGLDITIDRYTANAIIETRPFVVSPEQRVRDAKEFFSRVRVGGSDVRGEPTWLRFHMYPFEKQAETLRRHIYEPTVVTLADGRRFELMFSRQRSSLPAEIALDEFRLSTHMGGFTGESGTIRDYTSMLRFRDSMEADWGTPTPVSMNKPVEHGGYWYFQAQWDPPEEARREGQRASAGLNYTVLGVGNRNGVYVQLLGSIIAVIGMIYAFYVKPIIKQWRKKKIYASMASRGKVA